MTWHSGVRFLAVALAAAGCQSPGTGPSPSPAKPPASQAQTATDKAADPKPADKIALDPATLSELMAIAGELDPQRRDDLMELVKTSDPSHVPGILKTWKLSLAQRRKQIPAPAGTAEADPSVPARRATDTEPKRQEAAAPAAPIEVALAPPAFPDRLMQAGRKNERPAESVAGGSGKTAQAAGTAAEPDTADTALGGQLQANTAVSLAPESVDQAPAVDPDQQFQKLLEGLAKVAAQRAGSKDADLATQFYSRLLHLMEGDQNKAFEPLNGVTPADQEFCRQLLWAIANYLDAKRMNDPSDRATVAVEKLTEAMHSLRRQAELVVRHVTFCKKIVRFGQYTPVETATFAAGQPVLLYCELDNLVNERTSDDQVRTLIAVTVTIYDSRGAKVKQYPTETAEFPCRRPMTDYFVTYRFAMPERIYSGPHTLKILVEDKLGGKVGEGKVEFSIR